MKVQLEPHENEFARADGRYQVSDFAIAISNSSKLCPVRIPPPTESELKLRSILRSKKISFKHSQVIWYTGCDKYTPDLIISEKLTKSFITIVS